MGASCCNTGPAKPAVDPAYRRVLWAALIINASLFAVEIVAGAAAGSASLLADSADFLADSANYAISLFVLGAALAMRARAALVKGLSMGLIGLLVASNIVWRLFNGQVPEAEVMGVVGLLALVANMATVALLYAFRQGDANMRSVWICSRNDAIGNIAVMLAAAGVFGTGSNWPDLIVAAIMAWLALSGAVQIVMQARRELAQPPLGTLPRTLPQTLATE